MIAPRAVALITALAILLAPSITQAAERRIAILVGNDHADTAHDPLRWATRDAREMQSVLSALAGVKTTHLLLDRDPDALRATWTKVQDDLERDPTPATLFFFYSGHADDRSLLMGEDRYDFDELRRTLERMPVQLFVAVIDACQSGAVARIKGGSAVPVLDLDIRDTNTMQKGGVYITSGSFGEAAQESDEIEASYFTHYFVSGLRGAADDSGDRRVSLEEAYRFAYIETLKNTQRTLLGPQHPSWEVDVQGQGQLVLTWLDDTASYIVLPERAEGRWFVRRADADVFAEAEKKRGKRLRIAVEPGEYEVGRAEGENEHFGRIAVARGAEAIVDESHLATRPLVRNASKGGASEVISAGYHFANGYLVDATPVHALRLRIAKKFGAWELGGVVHYGQSAWRRHDELAIELRELGGGASLSYRLDLSRALAVFGGAELLVTYAHERAVEGAHVSLQSLVVPVDARAGVRVQLFGPIAAELAGSIGAVFYPGPENTRAALTPGFELALRAAP